YTFDIIAVGACPYDQDRMRSANLSLSNVAVESQGLSAIRKGKFKFSYSLSDLSNIPPLSTTYSVFSPWLLVLKSGSSSNLLGDNSQEISDVNLETAGYHTFVVSSVCNNLNNKSHSPHPALEKGSKFRVAPAVCISNGWPFSGNAFCAYKHLGKVMHPDGLSSCNSEVRPDPQTNERRGGVIINAEPWQAFRSLHENAVFEFSGHGNEDSLYLGEDQSGKEKWFSVNWIENDTLTPPGSLSHLVFALFNGCDAGQTFPQAVVNKGAEASLGFNREISVVVCSTWERAFWKYATKYYTLGAQIFPPASVAQAAKLAFRDVWWKPWNWNPIAPFFIKRMQDSMVVVGDTYLYPARKGKILR
ncbi:hypothetical protein H5T87_11180, partial [bacterium]|nr:hypothetical protein [bacterium]